MRNTGEFTDPLKPRSGVRKGGKKKGRKLPRLVSLEMHKGKGQYDKVGDRVGG